MTRKMAAAARKGPAPTVEPVIRDAPPGPQLASSEAVPVASHVHDLQDLLARRLDRPEAAKWPARATISFVVVVCATFWVGLFVVVRLLIH